QAISLLEMRVAHDEPIVLFPEHEGFRGAFDRVVQALSRGRCGLWDFDLENREFFWSRSMYDMLGLPGSDKTMGVGEAARLMHP
ncbi:hypothetical protein ACC685_37865, partial [Rhizobium ruizarguesonis]